MTMVSFRAEDTGAMQRILAIGDDLSLISGLRNAPLPGTYEVETVQGEADALRCLREKSFDLVLTNPTSPVGKDLALLKEMRLIRPGLRTIVLAPAATPEEIIAVLRAKVFACFTQPFAQEEIIAMVARALEETNWRDGIDVLSAQRDWIALRVSCRLLTAERLVRFMTELRSDLPDPERGNLITAFREILLNAMEHGAGFDSEKVIEVAAVRTDRAIVYHFRDPGPGFHRETLSHAAIANPPEDPLGHVERRAAQGLRPGGFGILIAAQLVDELTYNEAGNEVLLIKHTR
jgi:anti-sigma regulatory factor (Ser/Thr protein kinase)/ActR/RegA family two-component response regulator